MIDNGWTAVTRIPQEAEGRMERKTYQVPVEFDQMSERQHLGTGVPKIAAMLRFDSGQPYTIELTFYVVKPAAPPSWDEVTWTFSREILTAGLFGPAGSMDVKAWPATVAGHGYVYLRFSDRSNEAVFRTGWWIISQFMREVDRLVPILDASNYLGDSLDQGIARLLSDGTKE